MFSKSLPPGFINTFLGDCDVFWGKVGPGGKVVMIMIHGPNIQKFWLFSPGRIPWTHMNYKRICWKIAGEFFSLQFMKFHLLPKIFGKQMQSQKQRRRPNHYCSKLASNSPETAQKLTSLGRTTSWEIWRSKNATVSMFPQEAQKKRAGWKKKCWLDTNKEWNVIGWTASIVTSTTEEHIQTYQ